jgi:hypothetical protein
MIPANGTCIISCHGSEDGLSLALDDISFAEFGKMARPYLKDRRLFFSACSIAKKELAKSIMTWDGCFSLIGPTNDIRFSDAAIMWASFYHLVFKDNKKAMKREGVSRALQKVCNAFGTSIRYFRRTSAPPFFSSAKYSPQSSAGNDASAKRTL